MSLAARFECTLVHIAFFFYLKRKVVCSKIDAKCRAEPTQNTTADLELWGAAFLPSMSSMSHLSFKCYFSYCTQGCTLLFTVFELMHWKSRFVSCDLCDITWIVFVCVRSFFFFLFFLIVFFFSPSRVIISQLSACIPKSHSVELYSQEAYDAFKLF